MRAGRAGHRLPARHRLAGASSRPRSPTRRRPTSSPRSSEIKARHGEAEADGPPHLRRRRLRQDRGRHPGRVQGRRQRQAGRRPRADDRARRAALPHLQPAAGRVPVRRRGASAGSARRRSRSEIAQAGRGGRASTSSSARTGSSAKDVQFKDLGLVIIDEEQRFGVEHKERLKQLRATVDVLTLTATPIPRTLHLSLLGIRDISNLETPPPDRLADRDADRPLRRPADPPRDPPRAEPRRAGLLRPQPRPRHPRRSPTKVQAIVPGGADRRRPRPDGRRRAREGDARRSSAGRPTSWWRRRSSRAAWTSPTPTPSSSTRPTTTAWPTCTSSAAGSAGTSTGPTPTCCSTAERGVTPNAAAAAQGDRGVHRAGGRVQDRPARPGDPRGRQHPRRRSRAATSRPSATSCTASCWRTRCAR